MDIVFMGTPCFAVPTLRKLDQSKHRVVAVVTGPDKARGRGQNVCKTEVKKYAEEMDTKILQPENLNNADFHQEIRDLDPAVLVVVAFKILPEVLINIPKYGAINLHASLLPKYRGAAPINWAIINGDRKTGYTIFQIEKSVDTGDILKQEKIEIGETDTCQEIHDHLAEIGGAGMVDVISDLETGSLEGAAQNDKKASKAPKINSEMGRIDWTKDAVTIKNWINGLSPYPGAFAFFNDKRIKFLRANASMKNSDQEAGQIAYIDNHKM